MSRDYQSIRTETLAAAARLNELLIEAARNGYYVKLERRRFRESGSLIEARRVEVRVLREE